MRSNYLLSLFMILMILGSCTSSQFSTTQRRVRNGHVDYVNRYQPDRRTVHPSRRTTAGCSDNQILQINNRTVADNKVNTVSPIPMLNPDGLDDQLIASTAKVLIRIPLKRFVEPVPPRNTISIAGKTNPSVVRSEVADTVKPAAATNEKKAVNSVPQSKKIEGFGLTGFVTSIIGLIIAGIPLGILSIAFGILGITRVAKHPERRMGKGFGIAAIIIGFLAIVGALVVLMMK